MDVNDLRVRVSRYEAIRLDEEKGVVETAYDEVYTDVDRNIEETMSKLSYSFLVAT